MNTKRADETTKKSNETENRDEIKLVVKRMRVRSSVKVGLAATTAPSIGESGDRRDCY